MKPLADDLVRLAGVVSAGGIITRVAGALSEIVFAGFFGTSATADAFLLSLSIPTSLSALLGLTMSLVVVPRYRAAAETSGREHADRLINSFLAVAFLGLLSLAALLVVFATEIVAVIAPGFDSTRAVLTVRLLRLISPAIALFGLATWSKAVLQTHHHFHVPAFSGLAYNIVLLLGYCGAGLLWGIEAAVVFVSLGACAKFAVQLPVLWKWGVQVGKEVSFSTPGLSSMVVLTGIAICGAGDRFLNLFVDRVVASSGAVGGVAAINYAQKLSSVPFSLIAIPVVTVIYPRFTEAVISQEPGEFGHLLEKGLALLVFALLPATILLILLGEPLVEALYERGAFGGEATLVTSTVLQGYSLGLIAMGVREYMTYAAFSRERFGLMVSASLVGIVINYSGSWILLRYWGVPGVGLATAGSFAIAALILFVGLTVFDSYWVLSREFAMKLRKIGIAGGAMFLGVTASRMFVGYLINAIGMSPFGDMSYLLPLMELIAGVVVGIMIYGWTAYQLAVEEVDVVRLALWSNDGE